ncbi:MAG TPA: NADH-quinone oxidoreductase subunit L [Pyrinomonadaceae bacterium]|jgi:NADH-quinone oxidoreductase subunit L
MSTLLWLIPLLPLAGAAVNGLLGRRLRFSERLVGAVAVGSVALAFVLALVAVGRYAASVWPAPYVTSQDGASFTWIAGGATALTQGQQAGAGARDAAGHAAAGGELRTTTGVPGTSATYGVAQAEGPAAAPGSRTASRTVVLGGAAARDSVLDVEWSYQLDPLSAVFMLIITGVGLCIFVFATGYMHGDQGFYRFFAYMGLFMFMMLVLVMGSNFLMMFVGWEGVGLCSYLLIGYYFDRKEAGDASRKAFITNRVGDFGFALAVFGIIATFGTAQYTDVMRAASAYPIERLGEFAIMSWLALGLFVGATGKSAQIPLYVWLPDAMAGPTPVSALIHAATMVTAGLYMLTRTNVIFQHSQTMMLVVAVVGALTALFAATIGITQNDIKKVLAYSTVSQLGFMFLACGVGAFAIGIFHVMTHAFFKALMFLGAGSVIHGMHHEQDMRRMGGLRKYMPKTFWTFVCGWLAICGIIPFSGFWSKDEILWRAASTNYFSGGWLLWLIGTIAATCTAFYMTRLVCMTFFGRERFREVPAGGEADEAHAAAYDEHRAPHDAQLESAGDRPRHEPGEYVGQPHAAPHDHHETRGGDVDEVHAAPHGHHVHEPHESPASMWVPLAALAVLATLGGLIGVGPAFSFITGSEHPGGRLNIVNWLTPVVWNPATKTFPTGAAGEHATAGAHETAGEAAGGHENAGAVAPAPPQVAEHAAPYGDTGYNLAHAAEASLGERAAEWLFILLSIAVALVGMGLGYLFYIKNPRLPDAWARRLGALYRASYNKYWIDELYGLLVTRRTMDAARLVYKVDSEGLDGAVNGAAAATRAASRATGAFDRYVVDGAVNGVAYFIRGIMSRLLRTAQTGLTANYALVMVLGLVVAVIVYFAPDFWAK